MENVVVEVYAVTKASIFDMIFQVIVGQKCHMTCRCHSKQSILLNFHLEPGTFKSCLDMLTTDLFSVNLSDFLITILLQPVINARVINLF